jgi:hypothetical protein
MHLKQIMNAFERVLIWLIGIGFGIVLIVVFVIAFVLLIVGVFEGRKAYWDAKVRELCERDGGVVILERVPLTRDEYRRLGGVRGGIPFPSEESAAPDYPFVSGGTRTVIRDGDPQVIRRDGFYKRRTDGKLLATTVSYHRIGGDFPGTVAHPSSFQCPEQKGRIAGMPEIFIIGD